MDSRPCPVSWFDPHSSSSPALAGLSSRSVRDQNSHHVVTERFYPNVEPDVKPLHAAQGWMRWGICVMLLGWGATAAAQQVRQGDEIIVAAETVPVMRGSDELARVSQGDRFHVVKADGAWLRIELATGQQGWIRAAQARRITPAETAKLTAEQEQRRAAAREMHHQVVELYGQAKFTEALAVAERIGGILEEILGERHPEYAANLNNVGLLHRAAGDLGRAEPLLARALELRRQVLGEEHPDCAESMQNLGALYQSLGDYRRAEPLFRAALDINRALLGRQHPGYAVSLNNLASLYQAQGDLERAEPLLEESLEVNRRALGEQHPDYCVVLNNLATLYLDLDQPQRAEPLLRRVVDTRRLLLGESHPDLANSLNNLAQVYLALGDDQRAAALLRESLEIVQRSLGADHPRCETGLANLAAVQALTGNWRAAADSLDANRRLMRRHAARVLPALSVDEQLRFLQVNDLIPRHMAFSLGLTRADDSALSARSAAWVINGKALAEQSLAERERLALASADRQTSDLAASLKESRSRLAALAAATPSPDEQATFQADLARWTQEEQSLSKQFAQAHGEPARDDPWVELHEARAALDADEVLIEIVRFSFAELTQRSEKEKWKPPRYAAWIVPAADHGDVRVIDLGPADAIDHAVAAVRTRLAAASTDIRQQGEPAATEEMRTVLRELAKLILDPCLEVVDEPIASGAAATEPRQLRNLVLSPDANLWLTPWAALPLANGSHLIEHRGLRYVVTGRDLVRPANRPLATNPPVILADPDFGPPSAAASAPLRVPANWPRLPGTAAEAASIREWVARYCQSQPAVHLGGEASESLFGNLARPRLAVLSTHGYFLENEQLLPADAAPGSGATISNPLLRCGLVLAGANLRAEGRDAAADDGILTGLEIVGQDLRGTELVVLSACETGLGDIRNGEGVAGLRQAFLLAGARSVLATLWQIPDRDTAAIMEEFFAQLAAGQAKGDALRAAQLQRITDRRQRHGAAHPLFWAAFTLTGE
jgi:CHAT domain-containing protein/tetratricopeptide (TPR) repeat protein